MSQQEWRDIDPSLLKHNGKQQTDKRQTQWLILYVYCSRSRQRYFIVHSDVTIAGLQHLGLKSAPIVFDQGRDLYRATPALTRGVGFCDLTRRTVPKENKNFCH